MLNVDIEAAEGVDVVADVSDLGAIRSLNQTFDAIVVSNLLEHVEDPVAALRNVCTLASASTLLIITGPAVYPYHPDPIDNGLRPNRTELGLLLSSGGLKLLRYERRWHLTASGATCRSWKEWPRANWWALKAGRRDLLKPVAAFCALAQVAESASLQSS